MTLGNFASAQASMTADVRVITSSWYFGLFSPFTNGAPGMPLGAMAQINPCFLSVAHSFGSTISTDTQPSPFATWHAFSMSHFSPAMLKHQKTTDCLMRPFFTAFPSFSAAERVTGKPASDEAALT